MTDNDKTPDEVEKLVDALWGEALLTYGLTELGTINLDRLRTLARDAAAVGARTALEDARRDLHDWAVLYAGPDGAYFARLWGGKLTTLEATYTTDEETTT